MLQVDTSTNPPYRSKGIKKLRISSGGSKKKEQETNEDFDVTLEGLKVNFRVKLSDSDPFPDREGNGINEFISQSMVGKFCMFFYWLPDLRMLMHMTTAPSELKTVTEAVSHIQKSTFTH
jgi:hypothetical protein